VLLDQGGQLELSRKRFDPLAELGDLGLLDPPESLECSEHQGRESLRGEFHQPAAGGIHGHQIGTHHQRSDWLR
jgi:hypothetical protein